MPPLTLESASALVVGGVSAKDIAKEHSHMQPQKPQPTTIKVQALRNFQNHERKICEKGGVHTLPRIFALEMIAANKAKKLDDDAPQQSSSAAEIEPKPAAKPKAKERADVA